MFLAFATPFPFVHCQYQVVIIVYKASFSSKVLFSKSLLAVSLSTRSYVYWRSVRKIVNRSKELEILVGLLIPTTAEAGNKRLKGFKSVELII